MVPTLEKRIETRGPDEFVALMSQLEFLDTISGIQADRLKQAELRDIWFYGGDGVAYGVKGQDVFLYLTDFANNPLRKNPEKASQELIRNHNFFVDESTASDLETRALASNGVVAFDLSELPMRKENDEWGYVGVSTSKLAEGRDEFKAQYGDKVAALFDRVHGKAIYGSNGIGDLLSKEGKNTTRIYMLNEKYVQRVLKGKEAGTMVARASYLDRFGSDSDVDLDNRFVDHRRHARGVVKEVAEGDEQKIDDYSGVASTLGNPSFDPEALARRLDKTSAKNLSAALTTYLSQR